MKLQEWKLMAERSEATSWASAGSAGARASGARNERRRGPVSPPSKSRICARRSIQREAIAVDDLFSRLPADLVRGERRNPFCERGAVRADELHRVASCERAVDRRDTDGEEARTAVDEGSARAVVDPDA